MLGGPQIQPFLQTIYERRKVARDVVLGVLLLWGMFGLWAWQYSATAIVRSTSAQSSANAVDAARSALTDDRLAAIIQQAHLYPEMVRLRGEARAIEYMRSRLSLQPVASGNNTSQVRITYLNAEKLTVIKVANALAQSLTTVTPSTSESISVETAATIDRQLEESHAELKQLAANRDKHPTLRRTSAHHDKEEAGAPQSPTAQTSVVATAPASVPSPQASAIKALQLQIKEADTRLVELRQRYTDQYPDVQDAQEELQELRTKLSHLQAENTGSANVAQSSRAEQPRAAQAPPRKQTAPAPAHSELRHEKPSDSTASRAYSLELDRYHALLRAQRSMKEYQDGLTDPQPLFTLVENATRTKAAGLAVNPFYWLTSLLVGLLAATLAILFTHRSRTPAQGKIAVRSQFEREDLTPQYRSGTR
jgi:hypothetical protein